MLASICAVVVNVVSSLFRSKNSQHKTVNPIDFIPKWGGEKVSSVGKPKRPVKEQPVDEQKSILFSLARKFGIKVKRREAKQ